MKPRLTAHLVAGYPTMDLSLRVAEALLAGGASYLEVQFPFSEPTADGPAIQEACRVALKNGFSLKKGFDFLEKLKSFSCPVFLMSYAGTVFRYGVENFTKRGKEAGLEGLIVPDLACGYDEGLFDQGRKYRIPVVPVVVPSVAPRRLECILEEKPVYLYTALRAGITGAETVLSKEVFDFLQKLKSSSTKVLAGFGIKSPEQVQELRPHVHALVAGSVIVRRIEACREEKNESRLKEKIFREVRELIRSLIGIPESESKKNSR